MTYEAIAPYAAGLLILIAAAVKSVAWFFDCIRDIDAMGVTRYMTGAEVSQGIPPIYASFIGALMMGQAFNLRAAA